MISRAICRADGLVCDTSAKLTRSNYRALKSAGVAVVFRYVFFGSPRPQDLDMTELADAADEGMAIGVVQHVRKGNPGWHASAIVGNSDGLAAVANAIKAGYVGAPGQPDIVMALDLEGVANPGGECFGHASAWCKVVRAAGYAPLIYIGYDSGLDAAAIDALACPAWVDYAPLSMRPRPTAGYVMQQRKQSTIAGIGVDVDDVLQDGMIYALSPGA
jgi:hypothetical protein